MFENSCFNLLLGVFIRRRFSVDGPDTDFAKLIDGAIETGSFYMIISNEEELSKLLNKKRRAGLWPTPFRK